ncbi:hypothetical protein SAMN02745830_04083 [Streptomyces sp. Amel2xC10]|nr:hypothetical protein SAMN02745830_04083 [Streptomyces sp. Amel2xC10]
MFTEQPSESALAEGEDACRLLDAVLTLDVEGVEGLGEVREAFGSPCGCRTFVRGAGLGAASGGEAFASDASRLGVGAPAGFGSRAGVGAVANATADVTPPVAVGPAFTGQLAGAGHRPARGEASLGVLGGQIPGAAGTGLLTCEGPRAQRPAAQQPELPPVLRRRHVVHAHMRPQRAETPPADMADDGVSGIVADQATEVRMPAHLPFVRRDLVGVAAAELGSLHRGLRMLTGVAARGLGQGGGGRGRRRCRGRRGRGGWPGSSPGAEGHRAGRTHGGEEPRTAPGRALGDRRQQITGRPRAPRDATDGQLVDLTGAAQPLRRAPGSETGRRSPAAGRSR